jgi:hypothetical protein
MKDPSTIELNASTEKILIQEMNDMVNKGEVIQLKDKFRMPYSSNLNTISSCSQIQQQYSACDSSRKKFENQRVIKDDGSQRSSVDSFISPSLQNSAALLTASDGYISYRAKYNNKNKSLMICKKASSGHSAANFEKRI